MKNFTLRHVTAVLFAVALGASACSSDNGSTSDTSASAPTQSTTTEVAADPTTTTTAAVATASLSDALDTIVADTDVPALGAAVFDSNGPIDIAVSGLRERDGTTSAGIDDRFHLGSNTKALTAVLVARLSEQDIGISFDSTLAEVFPTVTEIQDDYTTVTLAQLLAHTGGVPTATDPEGVEDETEAIEELTTLPVVEARAVVVETIISEPPVVTPNTMSRYSNANFVIAGAAMEAATGDSWENLMTAEVFTPLGMNTCGFGAPGVEGEVDQPLGHDPATGQPVYMDNPAFIGPAGTVHCSMADWGLLLTELLKGSKGESDFLTQASIDRLLDTASVPVEALPGAQAALGWFILEEDPDGSAYWHNGSNGYWFSQAILVPEADRAGLAVTNEAPNGEQATSLALAALIEMFPE